MNEKTGSAVHMYSPTLVALSTFLGGPIAGCLLLAHNCRSLGKVLTANRLVLWGVVATVGVMVAAFLLPEKFPSIVLPVAYTVAMRELAKGYFANDYAGHIASGGPKGPVWKAIVTGLACLCAIVAIMLIVVILLPDKA